MKLGRLQGLKEVVVIFNEIISQIISCAEKNELKWRPFNMIVDGDETPFNSNPVYQHGKGKLVYENGAIYEGDFFYNKI